MDARGVAVNVLGLLDDEIRAAVDAGKPEQARALRRFRRRLVGTMPPLPRMIGNLPENEQAEALAKIEVINKRHKAAGTLPVAIPRGAQR